MAKLDYTAWLYKMMLFEAAISELTEEEKLVKSYNHALELANEMAHSGSSKTEVRDMMDRHYAGFPHADQNWYNRSGEDATNAYMRELASQTFGIKSNRPNLIGGKPVHPHLISEQDKEGMRRVYQNTQTSLPAQTKKNGVNLYRSVIIPKDVTHYEPNHIESWTSNQESDKIWALNQDVPAGHKRVLLSATAPGDSVVMSHHSRHLNGFIPDDGDLAVSEEHVVMGEKLKNLSIGEI